MNDGRRPHEWQGVVLRRNHWVPALATALALAGVAAMQFGPASGISGVAGLFMALFGVVLAISALLRDAWPRARPCRIEATPERLTIDDVEIPLAAIASVRRVEPRDSIRPTRLELGIVRDGARCAGATAGATSRRRRDVVIGLSSRDADALIAVLGERRSRHRLIVPFGRRLVPIWLALGLSWGASVMVQSPIVGGVYLVILALASTLVPALVLASLAGWARGDVVVGTDGIVTRWFGFRRFISFADVELTTGERPLGGAGIDTVVKLRSGRRVRLRTPNEPMTAADSGVESMALYETVTRAFERSRRAATRGPGGPATLASLLARGGRTSTEWLASLDAHVRGDGYRGVTLDPETLLAVAVDPAASTELRVAAAAALRRAPRTDAPRLRVAAEATADPATRTSLRRLEDATCDEDIVSVLDDVREPKRAARRRPE